MKIVVLEGSPNKELPFRNYVPTKNGLINIHCKQQANIL